MSVAWTVGAWGNDTWLGMNAGPPNAWRGATTPASALLSGSVSPFATEAQIVAGGRTIILTLANDEWVAAGATFDAQRQALIDGITASSSPALGWNLVVKALQGVAGVVRTSDTVVTITLDAEPTYDISSDETITATIPASALVTSLISVIAAPTFNVVAFIQPDRPEEQASNWQADYWKHRSKKDKKRDEDDERIRLGILPPEQREAADEAIATAAQATVDTAQGRLSASEALLAKMEARERYEDAYRAAYREAYVASVVAENWKEDMRRATRRRKAVLLLLH